MDSSKVVGAIKHPAWVGVGTLAGVLTLVVAGVGYFQSANKAGGLEVSAVTVENVIELSGAEFDATGHSSERFVMDVGATPVDVTLKNNGRAALTIKKIQAQLINEVSKRDSYVKNCAFSGGGPAAITAEYALSLPVDSSGELTKQPALTDTEFKIEPGSVERLSVTIGPGEDSFYSLRVIEVGLRLIQDDNQEVNLPNIVLITPQNHVQEAIEMANSGDMYRKCLETSIATLDDALKIDGVHSAALTELRDAYQAALPRSR
ncbi:hypothetical protein K3U94_14900 [Mycolicibacter heraklionensis]|uniref:Uncharacterized protein n=1 Tax=Mycolicibacter heraklionensis TaxID=512402 RepID=A0A9X7WDZ0_9MYCO|nr:hypothetical protein [Mycolicibacter heraklionensis]QZA06316.1 hypothetical protein K3U94_14900 [Mycolicibacter heraklionensis]